MEATVMEIYSNLEQNISDTKYFNNRTILAPTIKTESSKRLFMFNLPR